VPPKEKKPKLYNADEREEAERDRERSKTHK
jgi:hypothetical protein